MAFGDFLGAFTSSATSIPAGPACTGSIAISVGDLIIAVLSQQTALTVTACGDNLNGASSYTAQNAGTLATSVSGRMFWRVSTVAGTLTTVTFVATSSANNASWGSAVFKGPFNTIGANPANVTDDLTTPYAGNATGTRTLNISLIVGWASRIGAVAWSPSAPGTERVDVVDSGSLANTLIQAWTVVDSVATLTPSWTGTAPTRDVLGTASFLPVVDTLLGRGAM